MLHELFELKNVANTVETASFSSKIKCYKFHQNVANPMENERFQLQNVAKTVEMAAFSSKMLHIARETCRKKRINKKKGEKQRFPTQFPTHIYI
jgi:hypothetical protein